MKTYPHYQHELQLISNGKIFRRNYRYTHTLISVIDNTYHIRFIIEH